MERSKLIPNSTQIPNVYIDHLFPYLTEPELRAVIYIARRTYGFQKEKDSIGLGQFVDGITKGDGTILDHGAGLTRTTAIRTLKVLNLAGLINIKKAKVGSKGRKENVYSLNLDLDIDALISKLDTVRVDIKGKRPSKPTLFTLFHTPTRVAPDTSTTPDTTPSVASDTTTRVAPDTHKTKGNKVTKQSIYAPGAHRRLITFFHDTCLKARGMKPAFSAADGQNLKRVLDWETIREEDLEKMIIFFLGSSSFKAFSPSMSTFLSAGILNGLRNRILNDGKFYQELNVLADRYYPRTAPTVAPGETITRTPTPEGGMRSLASHIEALIAKMNVTPVGSG